MNLPGKSIMRHRKIRFRGSTFFDSLSVYSRSACNIVALKHKFHRLRKIIFLLLKNCYYTKNCQRSDILKGVLTMTSKNKGHYAKKHSPDRKVNPLIAEAVRKMAKQGRLPCAVAFEIAKELDILPDEVGFTLDHLEIKIIRCQMGIFGYDHDKPPFRPLDSVSVELKET